MKWLWLTAICILSGIPCFGKGLEADALYELQGRLSKQITADLQATFGSERKFLVQVWADEKKDATQANRAPANENEVIDLGYMTYAFSPKSKEPDFSTKDYRFKVSIKTNGPLDSKDKKLIEETARFSTLGLSPQITVSEGTFKTDESKLDRNPANDKDAESKAEGLSKWLNQALFGIFILVLFATSLLLRSGFVNSAQNLASGIQSLRSIKIDQKIPEPVGPTATADENAKSAAATVTENLVDETLKTDAHKLILMIKDSLQQRPRSILSLSMDSQNQVGIRWLLTQMDASEVQLLQSVLGGDYFDQLLQISSEQVQESNLKGWLRSFTESLILLNLKEPGLLEEALNPKELSELLGLKPELIFSSLQDELTPPVFRVLAELTPDREFTDLSKRFSEDHWEQMLKSKDCEPADIKKALLQIRAKMGTEASNQPKQFKKTENLQRKLHTSLLQKFENLAPQDEERFLDQIRQNYPGLYQTIRSEIWFVEDLNTVPENHLKAAILEKGAEEIFALVLGLPKPWPEKIKSYLPEGTKKTIILDLVQKAASRSAPTEMEAVYKFCRQFIADLKSQAAKGKFKQLERRAG